jgi:hypothetical protein
MIKICNLSYLEIATEASKVYGAGATNDNKPKPQESPGESVIGSKIALGLRGS